MRDAADAVAREAAQLQVEVDGPGAVDDGRQLRAEGVELGRVEAEVGAGEVGGEGGQFAARGVGEGGPEVAGLERADDAVRGGGRRRGRADEAVDALHGGEGGELGGDVGAEGAGCAGDDLGVG